MARAQSLREVATRAVLTLGAATLFAHEAVSQRPVHNPDPREWRAVTGIPRSIKAYRPSHLVVLNSLIGAATGALAATRTRQPLMSSMLRGAGAGTIMGLGEYFGSRKIEYGIPAKALVTVGSSELRNIIEGNTFLHAVQGEIGPFAFRYARDSGTQWNLAPDNAVDVLASIVRSETFLLEESALLLTPVFETDFKRASLKGQVWTNVIRVRRLPRVEERVYFALPSTDGNKELLYTYRFTKREQRITAMHENSHVFTHQWLTSYASIINYQRLDSAITEITPRFKPVSIENIFRRLEQYGFETDGLRTTPLHLIERIAPYSHRFSEVKGRTSGVTPAFLIGEQRTRR